MAKSPFLTGKLTTNSMAIFNSYVQLPEGKYIGRSLVNSKQMQE
jgi:hypothetical protein